MYSNRGVEYLTKILASATHESIDPHSQHKSDAEKPALTIAISRQPSSATAAVAQAVGTRLGWPVYDKALIHRIAQTMNVSDHTLESVDERHENFLQAAFETLFSEEHVTEFGFSRELVKTLVALAAKGNCILVGRGASLLLSPSTTLRVRLVAPLSHRIDTLSSELQISRYEAARRITTADQELLQFMKRHFRKDPGDPQNFDLALNTARWSTAECVEQIVVALRSLQSRACLQTIASHRVSDLY